MVIVAGAASVLLDCLAAVLRNVKHIDKAIFNEHTVLPDARPMRDETGDVLYDDQHRVLFDKHWTSDTDMTRYTDPNHVDYWHVD